MSPTDTISTSGSPGGGDQFVQPVSEDPSGQAATDNNENLPENLQAILKDLVEQYEREDDWVRKAQIKQWKKNEQFWHGNQYVFWSETNQSWMNPSDSNTFKEMADTEGTEGTFYDFVINVYKAHGEAIIAALSAQVPAVRFPPDDADNEEDLMTSKTYSKIADLILRHNKIKEVILQALFVFWNQGLVASYHAPKADKAFGQTPIPKYESVPYCEACGTSGDQENCASCNQPMGSQQRVKEWESTPKSRVIIGIQGPINVKISNFAKTQAGTPYIIYKLDQPTPLLQHLFPHVADKIGSRVQRGEYDYERIARTPATYTKGDGTEENQNLSEIKRVWLKHWVFAGLPESLDAERKQLQKKYPSGCYICYIDDNYAESRDEDDSEYWTLGKGGLSEYMLSDPWGKPMITIQELRNTLVNLTEETIEHGIPSGYADPEVLNFGVFQEHEARPGMVYPAKPKPGQKIGDAFYEGSRATLSKEVPSFMAQLDKDGQFVVGSFPSIYGGPADGKSRTAAEYDMSRQMALQRLSISWAYVIAWFVPMVEKCVKLFVKTMVGDEKFVKQENGSYINVWIRRSEMLGKVGEVEAESGENFPISIGQKQAILFKLLDMHSEFLDTAIFDTENRRVIASTLAYPDIYIPGEDQRIKQTREIQKMLATRAPIPINPLVDDDQIHINTLRNYMVGQLGLELESTDPEVYGLLMQHLQEHQTSLTQKTMTQVGATPPGVAPDQGVK